MGLGNTKNQIDGKLLILKIKRKDAEGKIVKPYFQVSEKGEDGKYHVNSAKSTDTVSGDLTKVELSKFEWEGVESDVVKLFLRDGDETFLLDLRLDSLTRNLYNSLFGLENYSDVQISLYETKPNETTGKVYPAVSVKQAGNRADWAYKIADLPKPDEIKDKKGNVVKRDYDELNAFFVEKLTDLVEKVGKAPKQPKSKVVKTEVSSEETDDSSDDSIPF